MRTCGQWDFRRNEISTAKLIRAVVASVEHNSHRRRCGKIELRDFVTPEFYATIYHAEPCRILLAVVERRSS